jgi:antitoxin component of MazEF toxin-antitoxin module
LKKVLKLNAEGSLAVGIPKKFVSEMQLTENDALSVVLVGHTLHITKIKIE